MYAYNLSFAGQQFNYSAAVAIIMGLITVAIAYAVQLSGSRRERSPMTETRTMVEIEHPARRRSMSLRPAARRSATAPRRSIPLTIVMGLLALYALLPLFWLLVNSTKTQQALLRASASGSRASSRCGTTSRRP